MLLWSLIPAMVQAISGWFEAFILERLKGFSWVRGFRWWKIQVVLIFSAKFLQYIFSLSLLIFNFQLLNHTIPLSGRLKSLALLEVVSFCTYSSTQSNHLLTSFSYIVLAILNGRKKKKKKQKEERKWHFSIKCIRTASFKENQYHRHVHLRKKHVC